MHMLKGEATVKEKRLVHHPFKTDNLRWSKPDIKTVAEQGVAWNPKHLHGAPYFMQAVIGEPQK